MPEWVFWFIYLVGWLFTIYPTAIILINTVTSRPDTNDYAFGSLLGAFLAFFWPIVLPSIFFMSLVRRHYEKEAKRK